MSPNPNENPRQPHEQPQTGQPQQQPLTQPQQQPPQQGRQQSQPQQGQPQRQPQPQPGQQPPQPPQQQQQSQPSQSGQMPMQGGQPPQQTQTGLPQQRPQQGPPDTGMQSAGMQSPPMAQQGQMQQMGQPGMGAQPMGQSPGATHLQPVTIDDIMEEDVVTVQPDTPVPTVTAQMETEDVGAVVVVDDNEPQSVVTDREVALALEDTPDLADKTAEDLMSDEMVTGEQQMSVYEALQQLSEENIRRLPIVDENGDLTGIVTLDDIIVLIGEEMQDAADIIQTQSPRL